MAEVLSTKTSRTTAFIIYNNFLVHSAYACFCNTRGRERCDVYRRERRRCGRGWWCEKVLDLFAFVVDPNKWNANADDTQLLRGGEDVFCFWLLMRWLSFMLIISNYGISLIQSFFVCFAGLFCFRSNSFACRHPFCVFRPCGWAFWGHLLCRVWLHVGLRRSWVGRLHVRHCILLNKKYFIEQMLNYWCVIIQ